ncbi:MAG: glycosyltransferase family 2 protein [Turneriella sp.]
MIAGDNLFAGLRMTGMARSVGRSAIEISVILPTYNEAANIPLIIPRLEAVLRPFEYEILVMDDNSPDGTYELAERLAAENPHIRAVRRLSNRGLSQAVAEGFSVAKGQFMLVMDADMQHDETVIPEFIQRFREGAELVVGTRKAHGGGIENWSWFRRFISWGATKAAEIFLPRTCSDPMSGFFALTRNFYSRIATQVNPRGFKILLEILARSRGAAIAEVGYTFRPRQHGESKLTASIALAYLVALYDLKFGRFVPLRFVKYALVGLSGIFINALAFWLARNSLELRDSRALVLAILVSIASNFFLNNFFTFSDRRLAGFRNLLWGYLKYNFICLGGAFINYAITMNLRNDFALNIDAANLVGVGVATFWNYFINLNLTWGQKSA